MPSLRDFQQDFGTMLLDRDDKALLPYLIDYVGEADIRLAVYRNNVFASLTEALADTFPAVQRLVGDGFFRYAAHEYIKSTPPQDSVLAVYGSDFADFLGRFDPASDHPYLPDVARLEFAWLESYLEKDAALLTAAELQALPPDQLSDIKLQLHPTRRFLVSDYPVARIWQANVGQADSSEKIDLTAGPCHMLVIRPRMAVEVRTMTGPAFRFVKQLDAGDTVTVAFETALEEDSDFNLLECLQQLIAEETFSNWTL